MLLPEKNMIKNRKYIILLLIKIIIILICFLLINRFLFGFCIVKNNNYKNINISPHDFLIYFKFNNNYQNNDIVFYNDKIYRVIGTAGQIITKKGEKIFIDSDEVDNVSYIFKYPYTISKDELFLIGNQVDSRINGCINKNNISGKLIFKIQIRDF